MVRDISACMCEYHWSGLTEAAAPTIFFFTNDSKIGRFSGFFSAILSRLTARHLL